MFVQGMDVTPLLDEKDLVLRCVNVSISEFDGKDYNRTKK